MILVIVGIRTEKTLFKESGKYWIQVRLLVWTTGQDLRYFRFSSRLKSREVWRCSRGRR